MAGEELTRALQTTAELPRLLPCRPYQSVGCWFATPKVSSNARLAVYRSASVSPANPGMVPVALASGSHLPGSPCSPRRGAQRQWSNLAIARTTPVLLGLFSIVTLLAHRLARRGPLPMRRSAWYVKSHPTFSDAIAMVRQRIWRSTSFFTSLSDRYMTKIPKALFAGLMQAACYAQ